MANMASAPAGRALAHLALSRVEWQRYQERYAALTADLPAHSCSVLGNPRAAVFAAEAAPFLQRRIAARALDVGCGVAPLPIYLAGLPLDHVYGIDPLPPVGSDHPFVFVQGEAECLPWPDDYFGTVVCATSLDHMRAPTLVVAEMARVLAPDGLLLLWETVLAAERAGPDENHAYRFTWDVLRGLITPYFAPLALRWTGVPYDSDLLGVWEKL